MNETIINIPCMKLLNLIAAILGLIGSLFLAKSLLALTPKRIVSLTPPQSRFTYSPEQIEAMSFQKAESFAGIMLIASAFIIQIISIIFDSDINNYVVGKYHFIILLLAVTILVILCAFIFSKIYGKYIKFKTGKIPVRWHCDTYFKHEIIMSDFKSFEKMVDDLFNIKKHKNEDEKIFIKRISKIIEWPLPNNYDQIVIDHNIITAHNKP